MKDLDINKDGVVDMDEFARWYFTGMKPYNGSTRTMLKVGKHSASIFNALAEKAKQAFAGQLKTKTHKLTVGFNAPSAENSGTRIEAKFHLLGPVYTKVKTALNQYEGTYDHEKCQQLIQEEFDATKFKI